MRPPQRPATPPPPPGPGGGGGPVPSHHRLTWCCHSFGSSRAGCRDHPVALWAAWMALGQMHSVKMLKRVPTRGIVLVKGADSFKGIERGFMQRPHFRGGLSWAIVCGALLVRREGGTDDRRKDVPLGLLLFTGFHLLFVSYLTAALEAPGAMSSSLKYYYNIVWSSLGRWGGIADACASHLQLPPPRVAGHARRQAEANRARQTAG